MTNIPVSVASSRQKIFFVHPSLADRSPFGRPGIYVFGKFLLVGVTRYLEGLELSAIKDVGHIGHFLSNGRNLLVFAGFRFGIVVDLAKVGLLVNGETGIDDGAQCA